MNHTLASAPNITTFRKGKRIGVNRDDVAVGYAVRTNLKSQPEHWIAFVYIADLPFGVTRVGFKSADEVVAFIGKYGTPITERNI